MSGNHDLSEVYPDLSDFSEQEEEKPQKKQQQPPPGMLPRKQIKKNDDSKKLPQHEAPKIILPPFLGGGIIKPPPPPPSSVRHDDQRDQHYKNPLFPQRERKNCIFVKNIPKNLNKMDKLMTFFKTYGSIKNVKVNQESNSACIRFEREQDAFRFKSSENLVFNRSYIIYDIEENFSVS